MSEQQTAGAAERPVAPRTVFEIDGRDYQVKAFKGSKGVLAFSFFSDLSEHFRPLWEADARFQERFREKNPLVITRDMAQYRKLQAENTVAELEARVAAGSVPVEGESDEDRKEREESFAEFAAAVPATVAAQQRRIAEWDRMMARLSEMDQDRLEIPQEPGVEARVVANFGLLWKLAEPEIVSLIGLALIPDADLWAARDLEDDDAVEKALTVLGRKALDELETDEVIELLITTAKVAFQRVQQRRGDLGNQVASLQSLWGLGGTPNAAEIEAEVAAGAPDEPLVGSYVPEESEVDSSESRNEPSSTDSPEPTDGTPSAPSSAPLGATS